MTTEAPSTLSTRRGEVAADAVIHAIGIVAAAAGAVALIVIAVVQQDGVEIATVSAYSLGLLAMLGFSALYNIARRSPRRDLFQRLDHAAIFVMIAGTYTPFTTLGLSGSWAVGMTIFVWTAAALGIGLRLMLFAPSAIGDSRPRSISSSAGSGYRRLAAPRSVGPAVLILLAVGGGLYSVGIIFHAFDALPFQNAIWHGFVLIARGDPFRRRRDAGGRLRRLIAAICLCRATVLSTSR